jgi:hypothetical protein
LSGDSFALAMNPSRDMDMHRTIADRRLLSGLWS